MNDYVPDYSETSSVGKRMLLLPDEVLRFPLDQALVIIRGQKVLRVRKFDYSKHPEAKRLLLEKTENHVPQWRKREAENERESPEPSEKRRKPAKKEQPPYKQSCGNDSAGEENIERVEDLFTDDW